MEDEIVLEGRKQTDGLEGTSPSDQQQPAAELNSTPEPTQEQAQEADLTPEPKTEPVQEPQQQPDQPQVEPVPQQTERTFTQEQVNELVGKTRMETREQTFRAVYGRYGVDDEAGMDELIGNAQRYDTLKAEYDDSRKAWEGADAEKARELSGIKEQIALFESGIDRARFDDAAAIIKAKGMEVTVDNIKSELATHPEWMGAEQKPQPKPDMGESRIKVLGNEGGDASGGMSEEEYALKNIFKI